MSAEDQYECIPKALDNGALRLFDVSLSSLGRRFYSFSFICPHRLAASRLFCVSIALAVLWEILRLLKDGRLKRTKKENNILNFESANGAQIVSPLLPLTLKDPIANSFL